MPFQKRNPQRDARSRICRLLNDSVISIRRLEKAEAVAKKSNKLLSLRTRLLSRRGSYFSRDTSRCPRSNLWKAIIERRRRIDAEFLALLAISHSYRFFPWFLSCFDQPSTKTSLIIWMSKTPITNVDLQRFSYVASVFMCAAFWTGRFVPQHFISAQMC